MLARKCVYRCQEVNVNVREETWIAERECGLKRRNADAGQRSSIHGCQSRNVDGKGGGDG